MTAALGQLAGPPLRSRARGRFGGVATVLAIVLPVPVLAALGLSLPLPATVERLAAKLVPFGDSTVFDTKGARALAAGSIVVAPGERGLKQATSTDSGGSPRSPLPTRIAGKPGTPTTGPQSTSSEPRGQTSHEASQKNGTDPIASPSAASGPEATNGGEPVSASDPGGTQSGSDPSPAPEPKPTPVDTVTDAANSAVAPITNTVTNATSTVTDTAQDTVDAGTDALGGIKPP
jgi:hypothetical protein